MGRTGSSSAKNWLALSSVPWVGFAPNLIHSSSIRRVPSVSVTRGGRRQGEGSRTEAVPNHLLERHAYPDDTRPASGQYMLDPQGRRVKGGENEPV
jgi:hypothetical protein